MDAPAAAPAPATLAPAAPASSALAPAAPTPAAPASAALALARLAPALAALTLAARPVAAAAEDDDDDDDEFGKSLYIPIITRRYSKSLARLYILCEELWAVPIVSKNR